MEQKSITLEEKIWAAVSYLWILSLMALVARKKNEYVRFHANQGVLLFTLSLFVWFPFFGWILGIVIFILGIVGFINALSGKRWLIPVIGPLAPKFGAWILKTLKI